jgi:hypothetical protein
MITALDMLEELLSAAGYKPEDGLGAADRGELAETEIRAWDKRWRVTVQRLPSDQLGRSRRAASMTGQPALRQSTGGNPDAR